jgi:hypothetical protein
MTWPAANRVLYRSLFLMSACVAFCVVVVWTGLTLLRSP